MTTQPNSYRIRDLVTDETFTYDPSTMERGSLIERFSDAGDPVIVSKAATAEEAMHSGSDLVADHLAELDMELVDEENPHPPIIH